MVLYDNSGALLGLYDAATLAKALDPPDVADLTQMLGPDIGAAPDESRVPNWGAFCQALTDGNREFLKSLPGFVAVADGVQEDWTSLQALDRMERLGVDWLPVVGADGRLAGTINRSRRTTRELLEIAGDKQ